MKQNDRGFADLFQRRPLAVHAFTFDLPHLAFAHTEALNHQLSGTGNVSPVVLGMNKSEEDFLAAIFGNPLGNRALYHGTLLYPAIWVDDITPTSRILASSGKTGGSGAENLGWKSVRDRGEAYMGILKNIWRWNFSTFVAALAVCCLILAPSSAQEKSVRPGINKDFVNPDPKDYVEKFEGESREIAAHAKEIVAACKLKPGMVVADVGAGTGLFTRKFAAEVGEKGKVYAVDIAPTFLRYIEKTCQESGIKNVETILFDQFSTKLPKNSVDLVFICDTYHHFEFPQKTLASIHDALRPGGQIILIEFHRIQGKSSDFVMGHVRAGQEVFVREIRSAGFKVVGEEKFLKENYFVRFEKTNGTNAVEDDNFDTQLMRATMMISHAKSTAAGFVLTRADGKFILMTAAHVLDGTPGNETTVVFRRKQSEGVYEKEPTKLAIRKDGKPIWTKHPTEDVAAIPIVPPMSADLPKISPGLLASDDSLRKHRVHPGDNLSCLGYPYRNESSNGGFPILRSGPIGRFPIVPTAKTKTFYLSASTFEGDSGGPVYLSRASDKADGRLILGLIVGQRHWLKRPR
jgi:predicted methyltransferase